MNQSTNQLSLLSAASFYSPIGVMFAIYVFSIFSAAINKGFLYIGCVGFATALRYIGFLILGIPDNVNENTICNTGVYLPYTGKSYSTFMLTYTAMYFIVPMILISAQNKTNTLNYSVIAFFVFYIVFDLFIKISPPFNCFPLDISVIGDLLSGGILGAGTALIFFLNDKISLLFINELNSNKEVCSVPSKQQFRCSVYKDGQIVGSSISP